MTVAFQNGAIGPFDIASLSNYDGNFAAVDEDPTRNDFLDVYGPGIADTTYIHPERLALGP